MSLHNSSGARSDPDTPGAGTGFTSDQRLQFLVELSTDYYWELDTEGRFTTILHGNARRWEHAASALLGRTRWEVDGAPFDGSWEDHKAVIEARREFEGLIVERPEPDGSVRYFESTGRPRFGSDSRFLGYTGITREVTGEVRERRLNRLDVALTQLSSEMDSRSKLRRVLELVCRSLDWKVGKYWRFDSETRAVRPMVTVCLDRDAHRHESDHAREAERRLRERLVKAASRSGKTLWIADSLQFSESPGRQLSDCAVVVPVMLGGKAIGAIEFRNPRIEEPDERLGNLLTRLADQLANVYQREFTLRQLRESEERYASTVELAAIGISHVGLDGRFLHANRELLNMLGYSERELKQMTVKDVSHPDDQDVTDSMIEKIALRKIGSFTAEKRYVTKDGQSVWVRINTVMKWDEDGKPLYHISTVEDISDRKKAEERVAYLATHDELTHLPNRTFFTELLARTIRTAVRKGQENLGIVFVDLDRFKIINDSLGHEAGDAMLQEVAARISGCVRESDCVARHGGDEFVVLLEDIRSEEDALSVARKIIASLHEPIVLDGHECRITGSVGVAMYPEHGSDAGALIRNADVAMYAAKQNGKNCSQVFSIELAPMSLERLTLEQHLRRALERSEFRLQYQPKVDAQTGEIRGVEALLRWWNHELGTITPAQFIPVAEDTGLIVAIGKWVLHEACAQSVAWRRAGLPRIVMSVNLSPRQFGNPSLLDDVREVLAQTQMPPELLELEITESLLVSDIGRAMGIATELRSLGIRLAIDDFGTGYSSLVQLKHFPLDTLKIDRSFIRDLPGCTEDMAITEAIIAMGKSLGVSVVAEGVETPAQREFLVGNACDEMQGFLFGKPCHPDAIAETLRGGTLAESIGETGDS
jgi:diguanylate cyclase (GGDEF)-like protein/PAS domain S-box-containing protein